MYAEFYAQNPLLFWPLVGLAIYGPALGGDFISDDEHHYFVMELLTGTPLSEIIAHHGNLPWLSIDT